MPSRDSLLFHPLVQVIAALAALAALTIATDPAGPASYGLSPVAVKWLGLIGILASQLGRFGNSPFAGENDANKVSPPRVTGVLLAIALGAGALSMTACAGQQPPQIPTSTPALVATTDESLRASADHMLGLIDASQDALEEVVIAEKKVEILMPPSKVTEARALLHEINDALVSAAKTVKMAGRTAASLKSAADSVLAKVRGLVDFVGKMPSSAQSRGGIGAALGILVRVAGSLVGAAPSGGLVQEGV